MKKIKVLSVLGTRPEVIKMAPVLLEMKKYPDRLTPVLVSTAQHREMLDQVLRVFDIKPDIDLNIMKPNQTLSHITTTALAGIERVIQETRPDIVLTQGDTTTVFAASLAAFYCKIPVGHVEAGLRSFDKFNPYPEEINRKLTDCVSDYFFAPTATARRNLLNEGIAEERIFVTGNTVVDALRYALELPYSFKDNDELSSIPWDGNRILLVTAHRRENLDTPLRNVCEALKELVLKFQDLHVVYPVHLNPAVRTTVHQILKDVGRIHLVAPADYLTFIHLMKRAHIILTDSGGVQEEAPSLGKPVLVMRKLTERPEAYEAGVARIVGTDKDNIVREVSTLLTDENSYQEMSRVENPYGDGMAARRIIHIILERIKPD
ncbi:MAG: UDP-N-acetylglucosamine 2-epimerase (non-hydrolyzing) [Nitrospirae bacterium]|nr:UDP-N-acetylglucosamine 2-epimerase (non-hydrolyzing) [Nitrospirota bacterium]